VAAVREALDDLCRDGSVRRVPHGHRFERVVVSEDDLDGDA
jgi:hypothetical protein